MAKIKLRNDTLANWTSQNPILLDGEVGIIDNVSPKIFKVGDGSTPFMSLPEAIISDAEREKIENLPADTNTEIENIKAGTGLNNGSISLAKLASDVQDAISAGGSGGGAREPITSGFTITQANKASYNGAMDVFVNTEDITVIVSSGLTNFSYGGKRKGVGQVFVDGSQIEFDNDVETLVVEEEGLFYIQSYDSGNEKYFYEGDVAGNSAPVANPSIQGTIKEGSLVSASSGYFDADGDPAGTHLYVWQTAASGSTGTTTTESTSQNWTIPTGSAYAGKLVRLGVQAFAQSGVLTSGEYTYTDWQTIAEEETTTLAEYTDIPGVVFAFSSLQHVYFDEAATTLAVADSGTQGSVRAVKDLISGYTGTEAAEYPSYVTSEGSKAVRFTGNQFLSFGDILDQYVNMQTTGNTLDVVALFKINDAGVTNILFSKYSAAESTGGMQFRPNGRHRISLARGSVNEFNNQTKTVQPPGNPTANNYTTGPYLTSSKVNLALSGESKQVLYHWGIEMDTGELSAGTTGISAGSTADFMFGGGSTINMDLFAVAIGQNLSTDDIQVLEGIMVWEHGMESEVIETFPILPVGHPFESAAPLKSDLV